MTFVLDATTRALRITIDAGAGADVQFVATYADSTSTTFTKGSSQGASNGSTAVDVVSAPAASTRRVVKAISFYNANATDPRTVTFYYDDNGTAYTVAKFTLQAGQSWYSETASTEEKGATILDATNRSIQFSIDVAGSDVQYTAAWADSTDSAFTQGSSRGLSNGTSAVTIVGAPAASTRRLVQSITFYNAHASATRVVTLFYDDNSTTRTIAKFSLLAGESWFSEVATFGFQPAGSVYAAPSATAGPPSFRLLSLTDLASTTTTGSGSVVLQTTPTIVTPRINEIRTSTNPFRAVLSFVQVASSANYVQLSNAATGVGLGPILETIGTGTDINFELKSKGTGNIVATTAGFNVKPLDSTVSGVLTILGGSGTSAGGQLVIRTNGTNEIGFRTPDSLAASVYYVLPAADGTSGQVLSTNGSGVLSWTAGGGAGVTDGDKGDITVSGSGSTWTIDNTAVTLAKIQNITDQRLLGRAAGTSGVTQELTVSSILSLSSGSLGFASQNAGLVLASPATTSGTPTFRSLVASDIPSLTSIYQPLDSDLTAIAALSGDGLLRKSSGTWAMDSATYLTANQTITLSGDVTGSGTMAITTTIANNVVTFSKFTQIDTDTLVGRDTASTGNAEMITVTGGIEFSGSGSIRTTAFTGDVTKTAGGTALTIANDAVTYAKMQNVSADRVLGRRTSIGDPEELTLSQTLDLVGSAAQGDILYRGASSWTRLGAGTRGRYLQTGAASADPAWATSMAFKNVIINGDMQVAQRGTSFTSTGSANNDDAYTLDRWYLLTDGQDTIDVTQSTDAPIATTGAFTKRINSIALDVETINRKFGIAQIVERRNCEHLIGGVVSLSFKARVSSTTKLDKIRAAVVAWSGSADSVTSDIISAWNAEDSNPTLIANATFENTPTTLNTSTSWTSYTISNIAIDTANTTNLIVFIWSDVTDTTLGDFLYITDVQLEPGSVATEFEYLPNDVQFARCCRYYLKWAEGNTNTPMLGAGNMVFQKKAAGVATGTFAYVGFVNLPVQMRIKPALRSTTGTSYYRIVASDANGDIAAYEFSTLYFDPISTTNALALYVDENSAIMPIGHSGIAICINASSFVAFDSEM